MILQLYHNRKSINTYNFIQYTYKHYNNTIICPLFPQHTTNPFPSITYYSPLERKKTPPPSISFLRCTKFFPAVFPFHRHARSRAHPTNAFVFVHSIGAPGIRHFCRRDRKEKSKLITRPFARWRSIIRAILIGRLITHDIILVHAPQLITARGFICPYRSRLSLLPDKRSRDFILIM